MKLEYTKEEIQEQLINISSIDTSSNFAAAAVHVNEHGIATHAGIVICYNNDTFLFHYTGQAILMDKIDTINEWYFYKKLKIIDTSLIEAFYYHCKIIERDALPKYGFYFGGSFYENGQYFSELGMPEVMTCVGFCLNVILGFLEEDVFFEFDGWNPLAPNEILPLGGGITVGDFFNRFFVLKNNFTESEIDEFRRNFKRITPLEYITSGFITILPITKVDIDKYISLLDECLKCNVLKLQGKVCA